MSKNRPEAIMIQGRAGCFLKRACLTACLAAAALTGSTAPSAHAQDGRLICPGEKETAPYLVLSTSVGRIVVELHEGAAPVAVGLIADLVRGPTASEPDTGEGAPSGYYDGLDFDHCKPHIEIRTSIRDPQESPRLPIQLDAQALGLDDTKITDTAEAMSVLQNELLAANQVAKKSGRTNTILQGWMDQWYETHDAGFLVGEPYEHVNRALGYVYEEGLDSRPVTAGSVTLVPVSPREASARMSIALTDMPGRTGRWMVIGEVVKGFELARTISQGPLTPEKALKYRPLKPVVIERAEIECR